MVEIGIGNEDHFTFHHVRLRSKALTTTQSICLICRGRFCFKLYHTSTSRPYSVSRKSIWPVGKKVKSIFPSGWMTWLRAFLLHEEEMPPSLLWPVIL